MNNYLLQIILFGSVYLTLVQSQTSGASTMLSSAMSTSAMVASSSSAPITSESHSSPSVYSSSATTMSSPTVYSSPATTMSSPTVYSSPATTMSSPTVYSSPATTMSSPTVYSSPATTMSSPTAYSSSAATMSSPTVYSSSSATISSATVYSTSAATISSPTAYSPSMATVVSSSYTSATIAGITSAPITLPINTTITIAYIYIVTSSATFMPGVITNRTVLDSVQIMVRLSFNLTNFIITVVRVEILSQSKATTNETNIIVTNLFQSSRSDCDKTCITKAATSSSQPFQLPLADGSLATVTLKANSIPSLANDTTTTTTTQAPSKYRNGERPPGLAAQLGMGLGITLISLLLIGEIVFLYWKCGLPGQTRQSDYQLPAYNH